MPLAAFRRRFTATSWHIAVIVLVTQPTIETVFGTSQTLSFASPFIATSGNATLTHYDLPLDYIASCGCVPRSTHYPTAAINALVFGSNNSFGPACGTCFHLQLLSTPFSLLPPEGDGIQFSPNDSKAPSVVVKITDSCPMGGEWCSQTQAIVQSAVGVNKTITAAPNKLGSMIHFDLAWPSEAIPRSFFPLDTQHNDYGAWWAQYTLVDCQRWAGYNDPTAWGSDWSQQDAACCPVAPSVGKFNNTISNDDIVSVEFTGLPSSIDRTAQTTYCPSYTVAQSDPSVKVPNTTNELSRNGKSATANSVSASMRPSFSALGLSGFSFLSSVFG